MTTPIDDFNAMPTAEVREALVRCCGATAWVDGMLRERPFADRAALEETADRVWGTMTAADIREAFRHHPRIGDVDSLRTKFASTRQWAAGEQAGVQEAEEAVLQGLSEGNRAYEQKFGYLFIVCATGKSAGEMLALLEERLPHDPGEELPVAAEEQRKITRIRLAKLLKDLGGE